MRFVSFAIACMLTTNSWARGSKAEESTPPPPLEQPPAKTDWQWLPIQAATDVGAPGLWITNPPLEFAVDVLGVESMQVCAVALEKGAAACALQLAPCQRLVLPKAGKLRLELDSACLAREATGVRLQWVSESNDAT